MAERYTEYVASWLWRHHFRIPELVHWAMVVGGSLFFALPWPTLLLPLALCVSGLVGIGRWRWHKARARGGLAIPYFRAPATIQTRADQVQRDTYSSLLDCLPLDQQALIHRVPVVVGPEDRGFARRLRRRLGASFLLYGKIADAPGGQWSVYPRVITPSPAASVTHFDPHTKELVQYAAYWGDESSKLPPSLNVTDEEYPHAFCNDLTAVLRATIAQVELDRDKMKGTQHAVRAERMLREAIAIAPQSTSAQVDRLRVDLAFAILAQGRFSEARGILRNRIHGTNPSPELLRAYAWLLSVREQELGSNAPPWLRPTAIRAFEKALAGQDHPLWWDQTLYNLINRLLGDSRRREGALGRLEEFRTRFYRTRWYVERLKGLRAWMKAEYERDHGRLETAKSEARVAAKHYARTIRLRWRKRPIVLRRFPFLKLPSRNRSPILHANLLDAHHLAGQHLRGWRQLRIYDRLRVRYMRRGWKAMGRGDLNQARAYLDWSLVGRPDDAEASAWVWLMVVMRLQGDHAAAEEEWRRAKPKNPFVYVARGWIWDVGDPALVRKAGMPGTERLDPASCLTAFANAWGNKPLPEGGIMIPMPGSLSIPRMWLAALIRMPATFRDLARTVRATIRS
jgi:tetratricopeptide (TPR) repeat protein